MGKCIICGCDTNDFRCSVREENGQKHDDYQCEERTMEKVRKANEEYFKNFEEKALPYLLENKFKVIVDLHEKDKVLTQEFPIKDTDVMYCVDIIRDRMKEKGYYENWIDVHWEEYNGIEFEVVDYLSFALPKEDSESWVSYHLKLVGDNGQTLKARYC